MIRYPTSRSSTEELTGDAWQSDLVEPDAWRRKSPPLERVQALLQQILALPHSILLIKIRIVGSQIKKLTGCKIFVILSVLLGDAQDDRRTSGLPIFCAPIDTLLSSTYLWSLSLDFDGDMRHIQTSQDIYRVPSQKSILLHMLSLLSS